jgi:hypothetical protein
MYRSAFLLAVVSVSCAGCSSPREEPVRIVQEPEALHSDEDIQKVVPYDIRQATKSAPQLWDVPCHAIVPNGRAMRREVVFEKLGLSENRLSNFLYDYGDHANLLCWQVSPSFSVCCIASKHGVGNDFSLLTLPTQEVYAIRFFAHEHSRFGLRLD